MAVPAIFGTTFIRPIAHRCCDVTQPSSRIGNADAILQHHISDHTAVLTLNRPDARNALSLALIAALSDALDTTDQNNTRCNSEDDSHYQIRDTEGLIHSSSDGVGLGH